MRVRLCKAALRYGGGLVLHTATSGAVPTLDELYLAADDGDRRVGNAGVRVNIAYLTGTPAEVLEAEIVAAVTGFAWARGIDGLAADLDSGKLRLSAPALMLLDGLVHDARARAAGKPLAAFLDGKFEPSVATNQTLFWSDDATMLARADAYVARGFADLKLRVAVQGFADDARRLGLLRQRFGAKIKLAVDANGRWSEDEARANLASLAPFGLAYVEQPVAAGDWEAAARVAAASPVPIMLDESLASLDDVRMLARTRAAPLGHLKLVKLGGIAPTLRAASILRNAGIGLMIGQMNEGGLCTAAAAHVAAATRPAHAELYGADGLIDDPAPGLAYAKGKVRLTDAPGLGLDLDVGKTTLLWETTA
ncbi:MAG: mandelate racemase/muconate lactonizing enzyme family protein [Alphaproteobacteria bacterium]|nr:mandelate racemase/muconate lactonizing enzyme family protein [Alphaproteobacteria bacterium]